MHTRGRQNYGNGNGNGRVALLNHSNDLELSVPRNRNNREMIKIEVHKPENKMVSKHSTNTRVRPRIDFHFWHF